MAARARDTSNGRAMILPHSDDIRAPAERRGPLDGLVLCCLWTTGPDPALDGVLRMSAMRRGADRETWERFDRLCNPFEGRDPDPSSIVEERLARVFGVTREQLASVETCADVWDEFREFVGAGPIVVPDIESFGNWYAHLSGSRGSIPLGVGLAEMAALFLPGRLASKRAELVPLLLGTDPSTAYGTNELHAALVEIVRRVHAQEEDVLRIAASGYTRAWRALAGSDVRAAAMLQFALALLDRPSSWRGAGDLQLESVEDGRIVGFARDEVPLEDLLEALKPRCTRDVERWASADLMPPDDEAPKPFDARDLALVDDIFRVHLPASFTREANDTTKSPYRAGQHAVAREVARALGSNELLLMHAPTGTGKTLAYLVPAMLWARRYGVRVGIATYTRALQEQAMDREVPRALSMLARAGIATGTRVSVLKGRDNYVCWRALKLSVPDEDTAENWLAWTALALFALTDSEGELDRLPLRPPLPLESSEPFVRALQSFVKSVRAQTACCSHGDDRATCAAEVARRRAERSHVVIVNQAFALARQEFFKHVVFDECEHLHDQAHNAWSKTVGFREIRAVLARLRHPGRPQSRAVLDRLARMLLDGTPSGEALATSVARWDEFRATVDRLEAAVGKFNDWREEERRKRVDREEHSMLREYVLGLDSEELVASRVAFTQRGNALDAALAELVERVDQLPLRNVGSVRRSFDVARTELIEILDVVTAWIPMGEGEPAFRPRTFYDVERDIRGDDVLVSRVLLPNEFLGRNYYPDLSSAVFLSATTWLQDGFGASRAYLGLDRAANPAPDEERGASVVRTFRAPDVFDYRRVLVAVPRDAPPVGPDKEKFLEYVRRFIGYLGERTRGRMLVLFTNSADAKRTGEDLAGFFRARRIPLWFQNMEGSVKEELSDLFRSTVESVLFGVDTFWYGADFPGETLQYLVIVKLPYGVPDRYHHAQCAAIGTGEQRRQIYLPRALGKFRQGFGRLMRRESDRGCVFVLDGRVVDPRHRFFLRELPLERSFEAGTFKEAETSGARLVRGDTDHCIREALAHMHLIGDVKRRGLDWSFHSPTKSLLTVDGDEAEAKPAPRPRVRHEPPPEPLDIASEDLPF